MHILPHRAPAPPPREPADRYLASGQGLARSAFMTGIDPYVFLALATAR